MFNLLVKTAAKKVGQAPPCSTESCYYGSLRAVLGVYNYTAFVQFRPVFSTTRSSPSHALPRREGVCVLREQALFL